MIKGGAEGTTPKLGADVALYNLCLGCGQIFDFFLFLKNRNPIGINSKRSQNMCKRSFGCVI